MKCTFKKYLHIIDQMDVGNTFVRDDNTGKPLYLGNILGRVEQRDVGKRVYLRNSLPSVEGDDQFKRRVAKINIFRRNVEV